MCGNTEVTLEELEEYVRNLFSVAEEQTDNTNIELQFKVCVCLMNIHKDHYTDFVMMVLPACFCTYVVFLHIAHQNVYTS